MLVPTTRLARSHTARRWSGGLLALPGALAFAFNASAQPANDACASATAVQAGVAVTGSAAGATHDGESDCNLDASPDVHHAFTTSIAGTYTFTLCGGADWDTVLSLHGGCPASIDNQIACDDDGCRPPGSAGFGLASSLTVDLPAGQSYLVRISAYDTTVAPGLYTLLVVGPTPAAGACCLAGSCSIQTAAVCQTAGAAYRGDYTACVVPASMSATYRSTEPGRDIPDNTPAGLTSVIGVPNVFTIGEVQVELTLNHTFAGDLTATLTHGGRVATLMQRLGGGSHGDDSNFAGVYTFTDAGFDTIWQAAVDGAPNTTSTIPIAPHRGADAYANTVSLRAVFAGVEAAGDWALSISDNAPFDVGTLASWSLTLDRASGGDPCDLSAGACCTGATCSLTPAIGCGGINRRFAGAGTVCNAAGNHTTPCCKADFNQAGGVTVQDVFDFLAAYFAAQPTADISGDGVNVQDIFAYLAAYFGGC